jgi:hypothetical protein
MGKDYSDSKICKLCGLTAFGKYQIEYSFPDPLVKICRFCQLLLTSRLSDVWVYLDDKFTNLEYPLEFHLTLEDEARIRNLISRGSSVFLSDGVRLWRYGTKIPMEWATFNRNWGSWKQLHPCEREER